MTSSTNADNVSKSPTVDFSQWRLAEGINGPITSEIVRKKSNEPGGSPTAGSIYSPKSPKFASFMKRNEPLFLGDASLAALIGQM